LVTFAVFAYGQEDFIREAVAGAFAQTYAPLEIILSDDCSPDRTFAIMQELAAGYRGPHQIVLNRNPTNVGLAEHVNRGFALARGEWIVIAAGDDVSEPARTEKLMAAVGPDDQSAYSNLMIIDERGRDRNLYFTDGPRHADGVGQAVTQRGVFLVGASHAIRRDTHLRFAPLGPGVVQEDEVLSFRSLLAGNIAYVNEPLVRYRRHDSNTWHNTRYSWTNFRQQRRREAVALQAKFQTWLGDLQRGRELGLTSCAGDEFPALVSDLRDYLNGPLKLRFDLANVPWWRCPAVCWHGLQIMGLKGLAQQLMLAFLPHPTHLALLGFFSRVRRLSSPAR
jgi:glycosyltransferase involved in cell wall biosynthesis